MMSNEHWRKPRHLVQKNKNDWTGTKTAIQICLLSMRDFCEEKTSNLAAEGLVHILTHRLLIRPDNEALFEGALLMLQLLSSPGKKKKRTLR